MDLVVLKCVTSNKLTWNNSCIDTEKDCSYTKKIGTMIMLLNNATVSFWVLI
jgi:hypothetical protein